MSSADAKEPGSPTEPPPQPGLIYANHAGTTWPKPAGVAEAVVAAMDASPLESASIYSAAHATVARFFGVPSPSRLILAPSCTAALSVVISDLPWAPGDVVVTSGLEHHALAGPVNRLAWDRGVQHAAVPPTENGPLDMEVLKQVLERGKVRLVAMTGASNITGEMLPIAEVVEMAHAAGALVLLDGAQTAGVVPLSVEALGVDLFTFAGHKGPLGPLGIGGFWAAQHVKFACPSATCDLTEGKPSGGVSAPFPSFCDVGSVNLPAAAGLAAALNWLEDKGYDATGGHACALAARLRYELLSREHVELLGGPGPHTASVGLLIDGLPLGKAEAYFRSRGIVVRAGSHCAPLALETLGVPEGTIRVSFGASSREEDVAAILAAIDEVEVLVKAAEKAAAEGKKKPEEEEAVGSAAHRVCGAPAENCAIM